MVKAGRPLPLACKRWMQLFRTTPVVLIERQRFLHFFQEAGWRDAGALDGAVRLALIWAYTGKEVDPADED